MLSVNSKISSFQCTFLLVVIKLTTLYISLPAAVAPPFNQDIWIVELLSLLYIFLICFPILFLLNKHPNLTLIEIFQKILGKLLGNIIALIYVCFIIFLICVNNCHLVQFIGSAIMPETPFYVIIIFSLVPCGYIVSKGLETMVRSVQLFIPIVFFIVILCVVLNLPQMDFTTFRPFLIDSKFIDLNIGAINIATRFYEIILLSILSTNLNNSKDINKTFINTNLLYTSVLIIITLSIQAVLGIEFTKHAKFPYFLFTRQINVLNYIQRIESINVLSWFLGVFLKTSIYCYAASISLKQITNTKDYKIFVFPVLIIMSIIVLKTNISKAVVFYKIISYKVFPYISIIFIFIIPLLVVFIYFIRKRLFKLL